MCTGKAAPLPFRHTMLPRRELSIRKRRPGPVSCQFQFRDRRVDWDQEGVLNCRRTSMKQASCWRVPYATGDAGFKANVLIVEATAAPAEPARGGAARMVPIVVMSIVGLRNCKLEGSCKLAGTLAPAPLILRQPSGVPGRMDCVWTRPLRISVPVTQNSPRTPNSASVSMPTTWCRMRPPPQQRCCDGSGRAHDRPHLIKPVFVAISPTRLNSVRISAVVCSGVA